MLLKIHYPEFIFCREPTYVCVPDRLETLDSAALVASFLSEEYPSKFVGQLRSSSEDGLFIIAVDVQ